jgi:hypothetical protein
VRIAKTVVFFGGFALAAGVGASGAASATISWPASPDVNGHARFAASAAARIARTRAIGLRPARRTAHVAAAQ